MVQKSKANSFYISQISSLHKLDDLNSNCVPLGTLRLKAFKKFPGPGIVASDGWYWFCYGSDDLPSSERSNLGPEGKALAFLKNSYYIKLTYKFLDQFVMILRVYAVLSDFNGSGGLTEFRAKNATHERNRIKHYRTLFGLLDFSRESWYGSFDVKNNQAIEILNHNNTHSNLTNAMDLYLIANNGISCLKPDLESISIKKRLLKIYRSIESPIVNKRGLNKDTLFLMSLVESNDIPGLRTELYNYQINTICKMLQVEMKPDINHLPHMVPINSILNGVLYYINPDNFTFYQSQGFYTPPRGGILAEDMGLGKSLICLALTLVSKDQCSAKPDDVFEKDAEIEILSEESSARCHTMLEYAVSSAIHNNVPWRLYTDQLPLTCVDKLQSFPNFFYSKDEYVYRNWKQAEVKHSLRSRLSSRRTDNSYASNWDTFKIWLACSTLIVCPSTLFDQWHYEIIKHIEPDSIKVLYLSNSKFQTPESQELIKYDIVLISAPRFAIEEKNKSSPFKFVMWKRLIIDEGHSMTSTQSQLSYMVREIHAERRWAVSGTPTPGLTRMSTTEKESVTVQFSERQELEKIGSIVENFLRAEPWATIKGLWNKDVVKPFMANSPRSDAKVRNTLSQLVVRHKESDVDVEVALPPLYQKTVFLEPSMHNKIAVNLFVSVINVNAVTSEREDQDYLFNPINHSHLKRLMTNLQIASFYWSGFSHQDIDSLHDISSAYLKKIETFEKSRDIESLGTSKRLPTMTRDELEKDKALLRSAIETAKFTKNNKQWEAIAKSHEMCYYLNKMVSSLFETAPSSKTPNILRQGIDTATNFKFFCVGGSQLINYKQESGFYKNSSDLKETSLDTLLNLNSQNVEIPYDTHLSMTKSGVPISKRSESKLKKSQRRSSIDKNSNNTSSGLLGYITTAEKISNSPEKLERSNKLVSDLPISSGASSEDDAATCELLGTASTKLTYLISRLLVLTPNEKCIVFYDFDDIAFYIAEALDLVGIKYLIYTTSLSTIQRSRYLAEFHVHSEFRVLLMNVRLAAHGLNVSSASRVFFLSPIWRNDIESQAIKRAHRIGQRLPVHVETLVLRGTMEETMLKYRSQSNNQLKEAGSKPEEVSQSKVVLDFIGNHPYFDVSESDTEISSFSPGLGRLEDGDDPTWDIKCEKVLPFQKEYANPDSTTINNTGEKLDSNLENNPNIPQLRSAMTIKFKKRPLQEYMDSKTHKRPKSN